MFAARSLRKFLLPAGSALIGGALFQHHQQKAKFCGIMGYIGHQPKAFEFVCEGIGILENRGYDSVGIGAVKEGKILIDKLASTSKEGDCMDILLSDPLIINKYRGINMLIGHTRWATCGGKEDCNAHPHYDQDGKVALVHNGTILNHREIKENLVNQGVEFNSETDTEVIAQLIGLKLKESSSKIEAIDQTLQMLEGAWALVIIFQDEPNTLFCTQNGSHMTIGIGDNEIFVASEARAYEKYTKSVIELQEGEIAEIGKDSDGRYNIVGKEIKKYIAPRRERLEKGGYQSFFEKEIFEQKDAVYNALGKSGRININGFTSNLGGRFAFLL